jgi:hypothetical protein
MEDLLTVSGVLEGATGLLLVTLPSRLATLLLGSSLDSPVAVTISRVAGVALLALGVACWLARHDGPSRAARGLVGAMALYNAAVFTVLVYAGTGQGLSGIGLWPTVLVHAAVTAWCVAAMLQR